MALLEMLQAAPAAFAGTCPMLCLMPGNLSAMTCERVRPH